MNKKIMITVFMVLLSSNIILKGNTKTQTTNQNTKKGLDAKIYQDLRSVEMDLFNAILEAKPIVTARMKNALKSIENVLEKLETHKITTSTNQNKTQQAKYNIDSKTLAEYIEQILKPIKQFFEVIHENTFVVKPLVKKSLPDSPNSILIKFFDAKPSEVDTYLEKNLKTAEELEVACLDFSKFLGNIEHHLSKQAKTEYEKLVQKIKQKRK